MCKINGKIHGLFMANRGNIFLADRTGARYDDGCCTVVLCAHGTPTSREP